MIIEEFSIGDFVEKTSGDYTYRGIVVAACHKLSGELRYVVENSDGMLFIFNGKQLKHVQSGTFTRGPREES